MAKDHFRPVGTESDRTRVYPYFQRKSPSSFRGTKTCQTAKELGEKTGFASSSRGLKDKGSSKDKSLPREGILFPSVRSVEEVRGVAPHYRPQCIEQISESTPFQDGNCSVHTLTVADRRICSNSGSEGCVFPCSNTREVSEIPQVLCPGDCVSVRSSLFWSGFCSKGFYHGDESSSEVRPGSGNASSCLSGRLAPEESLSIGLDGSAQTTLGSFGKIRHFSELSQSRSKSKTDFCFSRGQIQSGKGISVSHTGSDAETQSLVGVLSHYEGSTCKGSAFLSGSSEPYGRSCTVRQTEHKTSPVVSKMLLSTSCGQSLQDSTTEASFLPVSPILGLRGKSDHGKSFTSTTGRSVNVHGCQSTRLGSSVQQRVCSRSMVSEGLGETLQYSRDDGHYEGPTCFQWTGQGQSSDVCFRQSNYGSPHSETGRDTFLEPVFEDTVTFPVSRSPRCDSQSKMATRERLDNSRFSQSIESGVRGRMDYPGNSVSQDLVSLPRDQGRLVCNIREQETTSFRKSLPGQQSHGSGRFFLSLGRTSSLCLSSVQVDSSCPTETSAGQLLRSVSSTSLARTSMVSNSVESSNRFSEETTASSQASVSERRQSVSLQSSSFKSTRLALIKQSFLEKGFSQEVSHRATLSTRESTRSVYDSRFSKFLEWCDNCQESLGELTIQIIAEFFVFLFNQGFTVNTIMGYRTAVSSGLGSFQGFTVGSHPDISKLIKGFTIERPVVRSVFPDWDLNVVLDTLVKHPFEPPRFDTVQARIYTSWKTVFLVALASANRASELHAISRSKRDLIFKKHSVQLRAIAGFLAKTQSQLCDSNPYHIADHQDFTGRDVVERLLCPKRMLKFYLSFTGSFKDRSRLFRKCRGEGEVTKNTVSAWLKNLIAFAYENSGKQLQGSSSGHSVRKMATSQSFAAGAKLSDILEAASWKRCSTFVVHYLKDVLRQPDGVYRLGAVTPGSRSSLL